MLSSTLLCSLSVLTLLVPGQNQVGRAGAQLPGQPEFALQHGVMRIDDAGRFSRRASHLGFARLRRGADLDEPLGLYGVRLWLAQEDAPAVWSDPSPRSLPLRSRAAIENPTRAAGPRSSGEPAYALRATFEVPVNRVGFELRSVDKNELNVVLHCFAEGRALGTQFFDAGRRFRFLGVQCAEPFDELWIEFTNPSEARFSLDNLLLEREFADTDRDGVPDFADLCPHLTGVDEHDTDGDGLGDGCDLFPLDAANDSDGDGLGVPEDNCPLLYNPDQNDVDQDGIGDPCDDFGVGADGDKDGVGDADDNCPTIFNPEQADCDDDGLGDVCDPALINPAAVELQLGPGECTTLTKSLCLPPAPPVVDVLILFDTTGSMGGEILALQQSITSFVNGVRQALPLSNIRFGLATLKDYPASYSTCGYTARYSLARDVPFQVQAPIGVTDQQLLVAVNALRAGGGQDQPEAYGRALWEVSQPDSGIGFRSSAARFVLLVGDAPPHGCNLSWLIPSCIPRRVSLGRDPGRDQTPFTADDVAFQQEALFGLIQARTRLLMIYTGSGAHCPWQSWCESTGGTAIQASTNGQLPPGTDLVQELVKLIRTPLVEQVTFAAENPCGLGLTFDPPVIDGPIDVSLGARVDILETICVPPELPAGATLDCAVRFFADDVLLGVQTVRVNVGCSVHVLDFETEDDGVTELRNGEPVRTPPLFGRLVDITSAGANLGAVAWDSTPGGPNDPSINSDMLIGHGNLLLLQDSARPQQSGGLFLAPTDDPQGGDLIFDFVAPVEPLSILLADINPPPNLGASVSLFDEDGRLRFYAIDPGWTGTYGNAGPHRLDLTTTAPQPGNGTPRYARASEDPGFLPDRVVKLVVHLTGFGAIDELTFCQ